jgi:replication factor C subunit 3/5
MFNKGIKLIILDEADSMTFEAQFALRRIIEKYSRTTRFCLICNYENKIIPAIRSRCANFRFGPISNISIQQKLNYICTKENITYDSNVLESISMLSKGDLRKSINFLQSISLQTKHISVDICYMSAGVPLICNIKLLIDKLLDKTVDYDEITVLINTYIKSNGFSLSIVLKELVLYILTYKMDTIEPNILSIILSDMSDLENRVSKSTFGDIYMSGLVGIFKKHN